MGIVKKLKNNTDYLISLIFSIIYSPVLKYQLENNRIGINIGLILKFIIKTKFQHRNRVNK